MLAGNAISQNQDNSKANAETAAKMFSWEIQKADTAALMSLNVVYQGENSDTQEYLTLTVAKDGSESRPRFISVKVPDNIVRSNGVFIAFAKNVIAEGGNRKMELQKGNVFRAKFDNCSEESCTAVLKEGYLPDEKSNEKIDIFQKFLDFDHVLFMLIYADGTHKSIAVPLFTFKQQYKTL